MQWYGMNLYLVHMQSMDGCDPLIGSLFDLSTSHTTEFATVHYTGDIIKRGECYKWITHKNGDCMGWLILWSLIEINIVTVSKFERVANDILR